jgi:hypothetical protein
MLTKEWIESLSTVRQSCEFLPELAAKSSLAEKAEFIATLTNAVPGLANQTLHYSDVPLASDPMTFRLSVELRDDMSACDLAEAVFDCWEIVGLEDRAWLHLLKQSVSESTLSLNNFAAVNALLNQHSQHDYAIIESRHWLRLLRELVDRDTVNIPESLTVETDLAVIKTGRVVKWHNYQVFSDVQFDPGIRSVYNEVLLLARNYGKYHVVRPCTVINCVHLDIANSVRFVVEKSVQFEINPEAVRIALFD